MELAIPIIALGGMYIASRRRATAERFSSREALPNADIPDANYPQDPSMPPLSDATSALSTINRYGPASAYTDKYFEPAEFAGDGTSYRALSGQKVGADYFTHNNAVPYFGSKTHENNLPRATEATLDSYAGAGSQFVAKKEQSPMFSPGEHMEWAYGTPATTDFIQSRINPSMRMANIKPFESVQVGPGLDAGYGAAGKGGFNSGMMARERWQEKTVDELRVANKQKASGTGILGFEGPATGAVKSRGQMGIMEKNRLDTSFQMDGPMASLGAQRNPELRAAPVQRFVNRPETTSHYIGAAGAANPAHYVKGEYMESTNAQLGAAPLQAAYAGGHGGTRDGDYGAKSGTVYQNNRMANARDDDQYFGAIGSSFRAAMAPILDVLRPSRKENVVGNLRPYENAKSRVENSYIFDPTDRMAPTIRETTEDSAGHMYVNAGQRGGGYETVGVKAAANQRDSTTDYFYVGNGERGSQPRPYDAEYRQRNNDVKASTIQGYMVSGNMSLMNGDMNITSRYQNSNNVSAREVGATRNMDAAPSAAAMGRVRNTQGLYGGMQADRNNGDVLEQLKGNPYTKSVLGGI